VSRSYKKHPIAKSISKGGKKFANRKVRNTEDIPNGNKYRKVSQSWDIVDQVSRYSKQEWIDRWHQKQTSARNMIWWSNETLEESLRDWNKWYRNK
jgi:hypothetical protein